MTTKPDLERERIRAARWEPGERFQEGIDRTLKNLPPRRNPSYGKLALAVTCVAVAAALFLTLGLPPLVRGVRAFHGQSQVAAATATPEATAAPDEQTLAYADMLYALRRGNQVDAGAEIQGTTVTVTSVRVRPTDETLMTNAGEARLVLTYANIPAFDPSAVNFSLVVDGTEIPVRDSFQDEEGGALRTQLRFDLADWAWDDAKQLELEADIGGEALSIPFAYDPEQAYAEAVAQAQDAYATIAARYQAARDEQSTRAESALPVGLDVAILDRTFTLSGFLYRDDTISLVYSVSGLKVATLDDVGVIEIDNVTVDGVCAGDEQAGFETLEDGVYQNVSTFALGRDPENLPAESLVAFDVVLDDWTPRRVAFQVNWADGTFALPADADEMAKWAEEADGMNAALYGGYGATVFQDLTPLGLSQEIDGVTVTLTSLVYVNNTDRLQLSYQV